MRSYALILAVLSGCGVSGSPPREPVLVASGGINHFAFAADLPGNKTLVSYSTHRDEVIANPVDAARILEDGEVVSAANFYLTGVASATTGLYAASYITESINLSRELVHGWVSSDGGYTWLSRPGVLLLPEPSIGRAAGWGGLLFHRRLHRIGAKLVGTVYGGYARDRRSDSGEWYRSAWAESEDDGATWRVRSTIAEGPVGTEGYGEPVSAVCLDGRILVVMRTGANLTASLVALDRCWSYLERCARAIRYDWLGP